MASTWRNTFVTFLRTVQPFNQYPNGALLGNGAGGAVGGNGLAHIEDNNVLFLNGQNVDELQPVGNGGFPHLDAHLHFWGSFNREIPNSQIGFGLHTRLTLSPEFIYEIRFQSHGDPQNPEANRKHVVVQRSTIAAPLVDIVLIHDELTDMELNQRILEAIRKNLQPGQPGGGSNAQRILSLERLNGIEILNVTQGFRSLFNSTRNRLIGWVNNRIPVQWGERYRDVEFGGKKSKKSRKTKKSRKSRKTRKLRKTRRK
jgi:hypothetical protein